MATAGKADRRGRAQYPPGKKILLGERLSRQRTYDEAFALPTAFPRSSMPRRRGQDLQVLQKFDMDVVYRYVSVAMPYFFPGDLTQEEYLAITAFFGGPREWAVGRRDADDRQPGRYRLRLTPARPPRTPPAAT